jgi:putative ABC transport system substrate-binding protein
MKRLPGTALGAIALVAFALPWSSLPAAAQKPGTAVRIGFLSPTPQPENEAVFWREMRRLGHVQGKNIAVEYRSAQGSSERLPRLAAELAGLKVDVIVAAGTQAALAAKKATATIPVVMVGVADPVGSGLVASLAHPGGNVTGASTVTADVVGKQLEVLHELLPGVSRVAVLSNPGNPAFAQQWREAKAAAAKLGIVLQLIEARAPPDLDRALVAAAKQRAEALLVLPDPMFVAQARRIADLATSRRLPVVSGVGAFADAGALATRSPDHAGAYRRAAGYVDRILKGAKPADLPVEQPVKFELVINAGAARTLGVAIPRALVARADRVIR